jgi:hypothetical protein
MTWWILRGGSNSHRGHRSERIDEMTTPACEESSARRPRDRLVWSYAAERGPARKNRLAEAYKELTGEDVESRLARLED